MTRSKPIDKRAYLHKPVTRRDFVGQNLMHGLGFVAAPSLFSMLFNQRAFACDVAAESGGALAAGFIGIELVGGANLAGSNVIVRDRAGAYLPDYSSLGLPTGMFPQNAGQVDTSLGIEFHTDSSLLRGIVATTTADTRAKIDGCVICTSSPDDTANGELAAAAGVSMVADAGSLTTLIGMRATPSGGRIITGFQPRGNALVVRKPEDALGLVTPGEIEQLFTKPQIDKIFQAIERLSESELKKISSKSLPDQMKALVRCGYVKSPELVQSDPSQFDPRLNAGVAALFPALGTDAEQQLAASVGYLVTQGHGNAGTIEIGGCDYHTGNRATGEERDFKAGQTIGQLFEMAALSNRKLMIHVYTDGGVAAGANIDNSAGGRGKLVWQGDSSQRSAGLVLAFDPAGRPGLVDNKRQLGAYKAGGNGSVDNEVNKISASPINHAMAVVLNYLAWHGRQGEFNQLIANSPFAASELDEYIFLNSPG